ncbi:MAG: cytochrome o ubiquinol oxidase subunit IV [Deltaproteobacteria bacterium]
MDQTKTDSLGAAQGSQRSYSAGFVLSVLLTAIAFGLVMQGTLSRRLVLVGIFAAAVLQILVHLHYFLHLNTSSAARWNVLALLLTVLIMTLFVGGTLWIMYHLNYRLL